MTTTTNGAGRRITTREALVKTVAVEIKTLTVTGKMVTQAVFRQLKTEPLLDPDTSALRGVPWGTVNYHAEKCADDIMHLHVVWQKGDELRRSYVAGRWEVWRERKDEVEALWTAFAVHAFNLVIAARIHNHTPVGKLEESEGDRVLVVDMAGWTWRRNLCPRDQSSGYDDYHQRRKAGQDLPSEILRVVTPPEPDREPHRVYRGGDAARDETPEEITARLEEERSRRRQQFTNLFTRYCRVYKLTPEECTAAVAEEILTAARDAYTARKAEFERDEKAWHDQWAELEQLDQLFIAV